MGFCRGLEPEAIIGTPKCVGQMQFIIKWLLTFMSNSCLKSIYHLTLKTRPLIGCLIKINSGNGAKFL